ncbi:MAG: 4-hydroxy-tetrahydrodipicolinate reductase [Planctomycetota bacterium]
MIRVVVSGSRGKMGRVIIEGLRTAADIAVVGEAERGDDLGAVIGKSQADVVVDFTEPAAARKNTLAILEAGAAPVVGTTGFTEEDYALVGERCRQLRRGAVIAPNFAIGAVLMMRAAAEVAPFMPDVEIIELHHPAKLDKPSGTALMTATRIREALGESSRGAVPIHSVRLPGLVAHQEIIFGAAGQRLTLRHDVHDRTCFVPGVLLAVRRVLELDRLVVGLDELLVAR